MIKIKLTLLLLILFALASCAQEKSINQYVISPNKTYQTIDNFGASDAWTVQYVGKWPEAKVNQMAEWLFSTENDDQENPLGIGLSLWRFNIGAGSATQGMDSNRIDDRWRRTECLINKNGTFDQNKQLGQRIFLKKAKSLGVEQFLGFVNSPPVYLTTNGLANNKGRGGTINLPSENYIKYSHFLGNVIDGLAAHDGIQLNHVSPFNEPDGHWNWSSNGQEGTAATKYEIAEITKTISKTFQEREIKTNVLIPESSDYHCMYKKHDQTNYDRGYQNLSYFNPDSTNSYVGKLYGVQKMLAAHSYWTTTPLSELKHSRVQMQKTMAPNNIKFWQTEVCIMSNDHEIGGGGGRDLSMKTALYVARIIHHDLVYANASAWHWWLAISCYNYKDGLIYVDPNRTNNDGNFTDSKLLWTLGNFSRFIRPGAQRIDLAQFESENTLENNTATQPKSLMLSAFQNTNGKLVVVAINYDQEAKEFGLSFDRDELKEWIPYLTNDEQRNNLAVQKKIKAGSTINIPARSVLTLVEN